MDATTINIINRSENQTQSWDKHGMLYRQYDDITESYLDTQLKIINQGLYITDDNWKTTRTGIGKFIYLDPKDGLYKDGYGVIADTICSNLILSEEVGIYNPDSSIVINKDGISVSDPNNTSSNKPSVTITPDGKLTCNGANIQGNITANSLVLSPNAMNSIVNGIDDYFVPFDVAIRDKNGKEYYFQVNSNGLLQAENAHINGTIYTSKLVGCTIDITDGINFRSNDKIYYYERRSDGIDYPIENQYEETELYFGSIYRKYYGYYSKYDEEENYIGDYKLIFDNGTLYIDTTYDALNKQYIDNMSIEIISGSEIWLESIKDLNLFSCISFPIALNGESEDEADRFEISGGDVIISSYGLNQSKFINLLSKYYGLSSQDKQDMQNGLTLPKITKFINTLSESQKESLIERMRNFNPELDYGGNLNLYSRYIEATCYMFNITTNKFGIIPKYYDDNISIYTSWIDFGSNGSYHDIIRKSNGLNCYFGWAGGTTYYDDDFNEHIAKPMTVIRGYTVRLACGGYGGGEGTSDEVSRAIDFDFDSNQHALFRPTKDNATYLGSGSYRWKEIWGVDGRFSTLYEGGTSLSSKYVTSSSLNNCLKTNETMTITKAQINMGNGVGADGNRYYINNNATGRFDALRYTSLKEISARRYKENIDYKDNNFWHNSLMNIKPCTYNYIMGSDKSTRIGVIAEDLDEFMPELVEKNENNECEAVNYIGFIIPLVSEVQRLNNEIDELKQKLNTLIEG